MNIESDAGQETCPGCGIVLPHCDLPTHAYIGASPSCWALFGEVLAKEYQDARYFKVHQLTVDAYAVQHPGTPSRRSIQSVGVHLAALYLMFVRGVTDHDQIIAHRKRLSKSALFWLEPPSQPYGLTLLDVRSASTPDEHCTGIEKWARSIWGHWDMHHETVAAWAATVDEKKEV